MRKYQGPFVKLLTTLSLSVIIKRQKVGFLIGLRYFIKKKKSKFLLLTFSALTRSTPPASTPSSGQIIGRRKGNIPTLHCYISTWNHESRIVNHSSLNIQNGRKWKKWQILGFHRIENCFIFDSYTIRFAAILIRNVQRLLNFGFDVLSLYSWIFLLEFKDCMFVFMGFFFLNWQKISRILLHFFPVIYCFSHSFACIGW